MEGRAVVRNVMNETKGALLTDIIGSSRTKKGEPERSEPTMTARKRALKKAKLRHAEYYDFQAVQDGLYKDSKDGKEFRNLIEIIIMPENIRMAYRNLKKNPGSHTPGTDRKTINDIEKLTDEQLINKIQEKFRWYRPQSVRRVEIPKGNGKVRPLGIPTIMDRLVQQCVLQVLEPICEAKFHEHSYGFRPNRSTGNAIAQAYKNMQMSHLHYVVDIDIKGFFDNVNHGKLLKQLWTLGIRDKKLISIISTMLKAEVAGIGFPEKGTPQGGIISPLLSNVVLNELDWWLASQWEEFPSKYPFNDRRNPNGSPCRGNKFASLRRSGLKEITCVRYADDFMIFTSSYRSAVKLFYATKGWLKDRLGLDISPEKSKIVNLKEKYSEFLGFRMKVIPRGKRKNKANKGEPRYVVKSHVREKSIEKIREELRKLIYAIEYPPNKAHCIYAEVSRYNSFVVGVHDYYSMATKVSADFRPIAFSVQKSLKARMRQRLKTAKEVRRNKIPVHITNVIRDKYGKSDQLRYVNDLALAPIGYVRHSHPIQKAYGANSYTEEGRKLVHKKLDGVDMAVLHNLMRNPIDGESIEFNDNRLSLYSAQKGKCAVTGKQMEADEVICIKKIPKEQGGTDKYSNLLLVCRKIQELLNVKDIKTFSEEMDKLNLDKKQSDKLLKLRSLAFVESR